MLWQSLLKSYCNAILGFTSQIRCSWKYLLLLENTKYNRFFYLRRSVHKELRWSSWVCFQGNKIDQRVVSSLLIFLATVNYWREFSWGTDIKFGNMRFLPRLYKNWQYYQVLEDLGWMSTYLPDILGNWRFVSIPAEYLSLTEGEIWFQFLQIL